MHSTDTQTFTRFEYLYRDASNYKVYGSILLEGAISAGGLAILIDQFESNEFFIAEQLGIPVLYEALHVDGYGPTVDDHCWHEFYRMIDVAISPHPDQIWGTVDQLIQKISAVKDWDLHFSPNL